MASVKIFFNSNGGEHTKYIKESVSELINSMNGEVYFSKINNDEKEFIEQRRINRRRDVALPILQKLMERYETNGYTDKDAVQESFRLADQFMAFSKTEKCPTT